MTTLQGIPVSPGIAIGEALILEVYCPEELDEFRQEVVDEYKFDDTIGD